jgi:hypothetical protein
LYTHGIGGAKVTFNRKRTLLLILLLSLPYISLTIFAQQGYVPADDFEYEIAGGRNIIITRYTGSATAINIPAQIQNLPVTIIGDGAFMGYGSLTSVTLPSSITAIGDRAFSGCINLAGINIPSSVTSIGEWAFYFCGSLASISIPPGVTYIGQYAFASCGRLTGVTLPRNTQVGSQAFPSSTRITYSGGMTAPRQTPAPAAPSIPAGLAYRAYMTSVAITKYTGNASTLSIPAQIQGLPVTDIGIAAFFGSKSLSSITIPSSVTSISDYAFSGCANLTSITIPSSVASIGNFAFSECARLVNVALSRRTRIGTNAFPASARIIYLD